MSSENHFPAGTGPCSTLAELSYVHVKKVPRRDSNDRRTSRPPMADRSNHLDRAASVSYPGYLNVSIPCTTSDGTLVAVTPRIPSDVFQLPPLPCASSLRLHSIFSDTVATSPAQGATSRLLLLQNLTSKTEIKSQNQEPTVLSPTLAATKTRLAEPSPVIHPNNPYVPWTPEMRREFLRPLAAHSPVVNSDACEYSHTSLQSESTSSSVGYRPNGVLSKRVRLSASLKNLASTVSKNLKQVAKRMSKYKGPAPTLDTPEPTLFSYGLSSNSFESTDAATLSTWLSDRQRKQTEHDKIAPKEMTLDEYEERGSWTHLSQSVLTNVDNFHLLDGTPPPRKSRSESLLKSCPQSASLATRSLLVASLRLDQGSLRGTLSARNREMSMPGGWTFG